MKKLIKVISFLFLFFLSFSLLDTTKVNAEEQEVLKTEFILHKRMYIDPKATPKEVSNTGLEMPDEEFMNTLEHEKQHMIGHIIDHYGIKPSSEEAGYLAGYVGALFTKPIKDEICDCCKKKLK